MSAPGIKVIVYKLSRRTLAEARSQGLPRQYRWRAEYVIGNGVTWWHHGITKRDALQRLASHLGERLEHEQRGAS